MAAYRYVVFPLGKQPTVSEVDEFQACAAALANRFAFGTSRKTGALAVAFDGDVFDRALASDVRLQSVIRKWEVRGCELLDHLPFVKDAAALRPTSPSMWQAADARLPGREPVTDRVLAAKQLAGKEALARSRLDMQRTLERYAALRRVGAFLPYALMGLGMLAVLAAGFYIGGHLLNASRERRKATIERLVDDPMREPLARESKEEDASAAVQKPK